MIILQSTLSFVNRNKNFQISPQDYGGSAVLCYTVLYSVLQPWTEERDVCYEVRVGVKNWSFVHSAQRVPEPDPLPGISFDTRPDPIQF